MKKILTLIIFFFYISSSSAQENNSFYDEALTFYSLNKDSLSINTILNEFDSYSFKKEKENKIYKNLGNKTLWFYFKTKTKKGNYKYLTIDYSYLPYGKVYIKKGSTIDSLYTVSYNKLFPYKNIFYKDPVWKIPLDSENEYYLKIKNITGRTRLNITLETENQFLKRVQTEYLIFGLFIAFLLSMILIVLFFSILKKEYIVTFYALYIATALIEFLAGKGLGIQLFWSENKFLIDNIRIISQIIGTASMGVFYWKFYKLKREQNKSELIFKIGVLLSLVLLSVYVYKYFFEGLNGFYVYVQIILQIIIFCWALNHIYLTIKNKIPTYLVIAFILPLFAIILGQSTNPNINSYLWIKFSGPNLYYIFLSLEIILFTRFIFGSVIDTQQKYFKLKKISDELKYNFQDNLLKIQHQERNKLVSNVHDTFGGYLEALKLRLSLKSDNTQDKVQEILDAFYKDYRYLLNSLYAPKINSENFIESLIELCDKLNNLTDSNINHQLKIEKTKLSQEKCLHLYRIISELLTNAIKHAKASEINIFIGQENNNEILLKVSDNGIGFETNTNSNKGFGLSNIKNRVQQINAKMKMASTTKGTSFEIKISKND
jgi:signal transduction histidine kinase